MKLNELFNDALPLITTYAPTFARAIGGFPGIAISYAIPLLANAFNADPTNFGSIISSLQADPNNQDKLKKLEADHGNWVNELFDNANRLSSAEINIKLAWEKD